MDDMRSRLWRGALNRPAVSLWRKWVLMALGGALAGCVTVEQPVYYAAPKPLPVDAGLNACVAHAAVAQRTAFPDDFRYLRFMTADLLAMPFQRYVGSQPVTKIYDGVGQWYGVNDYRVVRFHCLLGADNRALYTFVRPE